MKKLLAILLTLAMLVPMCGFAEESAPGATRTSMRRCWGRTSTKRRKKP